MSPSISLSTVSVLSRVDRSIKEPRELANGHLKPPKSKRGFLQGKNSAFSPNKPQNNHPYGGVFTLILIYGPPEVKGKLNNLASNVQ